MTSLRFRGELLLKSPYVFSAKCQTVWYHWIVQMDTTQIAKTFGSTLLFSSFRVGLMSNRDYSRVFAIWARCPIFRKSLLINFSLKQILTTTLYWNLSQCAHEWRLDSDMFTAIHFGISLSRIRRSKYYLFLQRQYWYWLVEFLYLYWITMWQTFIVDFQYTTVQRKASLLTKR